MGGSAVNVVLAGGGTAGHISPMLSMARALRRRAQSENFPLGVTIVGTAEGMEADLVPAAGFELSVIDRVPMPRRPNMDLVKLPKRLRGAVRRAKEIISSAQADVVVGVGGYVSTPVYLAARKLGVPVVVHEGNVRAGLANKVGAKHAAVVGTAFPEVKLPGARCVGMPMRQEITTLDTSEEGKRQARERLGLEPDRLTVVATGGSSGALALNKTVSSVAEEMVETGAQVLHLTGKGKVVEGTDGQRLDFPGYHQVEYVDGLENVYAAADLVIARSGAATVCELAAVGLPAVLVPLPIGNGEQSLNAAGLVEDGGALLIDDDDFTQQWAKDHILPLLNAPEQLAKMAVASQNRGVKDADEVMADLIFEAAGSAVPNETRKS